MTSRPRAASKVRSSTSSATSSERLSAAANPSSSIARSRTPGERGGVDRLEQPRERLELERLGFAQRPHAALAADAGEDRGDRGRVARVGLVLRAVRGGDRGGALGDRDRAELAVGLCGQERGDRLRRGGHRPQPARDAPVGEHAPVALVCAPGRRRERRCGVAGGALELPLDRGRWSGRAGRWEGSVGHRQVAGISFLIRAPEWGRGAPLDTSTASSGQGAAAGWKGRSSTHDQQH